MRSRLLWTMEKIPWIDAFVMHMAALGATPHKLVELTEQLWSHLGQLDPVWVAEAAHAIGDFKPGGFPDTRWGEADCIGREADAKLTRSSSYCGRSRASWFNPRGVTIWTLSRTGPSEPDAVNLSIPDIELRSAARIFAQKGLVQ